MPESAECPRCGEGLALVAESLPPFCPACGGQLDSVQIVPEPKTPFDEPLPDPPRKSKIEIIEATNEQFLLKIPAGGKRVDAIDFIGVVFLIIAVMGSLIVLMVLPQAQGGNANGALTATMVVIGLAWLVALLTLGYAVRVRFTRGYLFLSKERAVYQEILFRRKKSTTIALDAGSHARLAPTTRSADKPNYKIEIEGTDGIIEYGGAFKPAHQEWYVDAINHFLGEQYKQEAGNLPRASQRDRFGNVDPTCRCPACGQLDRDDEAARCAVCGADFEREGRYIVAARVTEELSPETLTADSPLNVSRSAAGEWVLSYRMREVTKNPSARGGLLAFGIFWETALIAFSVFMFVRDILRGNGGGTVFQLVMLPFHLFGLGASLLSLYTVLGGFQLQLGRERSSARWYLGPVGYTRRFLTSSVTEIKLVRNRILPDVKNAKGEWWSASPSEGSSCLLMADEKQIPVTADADERESRRLAGLLRYCLHDLGHHLPDDDEEVRHA